MICKITGKSIDEIGKIKKCLIKMRLVKNYFMHN